MRFFKCAGIRLDDSQMLLIVERGLVSSFRLTRIPLDIVPTITWIFGENLSAECRMSIVETLYFEYSIHIYKAIHSLIKSIILTNLQVAIVVASLTKV